MGKIVQGWKPQTLVTEKKLYASCSASRMKPAGSSWLGTLGAGEEGDSALWGNDVVFSVGGSPSLNLSGASGEPGDRGRERGKKREQSFSVSAILWASVNTRAWALVPWKEEGRGIPSGPGLSAWVVSWGGFALLAACVWAAQQLPSLLLGPARGGWSILGVPFAFLRAGTRG